MKKSLLLLVSISSLCLLNACGGGSGGGGTRQVQTLLLASTVPPAATAGVVYPGFTFTVASGGTAPFTLSESGALPPGLSLSTGGALSGTPTHVGSFPITVSVKDSSSPQQTASQAFTIFVNNAGNLAISSTPPPPAVTVGNVYPNFTFIATGGVGPLTWSETGALPPGLVLSNSGALFGTPTSAGSFPITVMVRDSLGENAIPQNFTIRISSQGSVFTQAGSMETPRQSHTATMLNSGKVLVTGGLENNNNALATAEAFDPVSRTFTSTGSMETAREAHTATLLSILSSSNGKVLVTGGLDNNNNPLATAELFDPASGTFTPTTGTMETAREAHTATQLKDGKVLVTGGFDGGNVLATAELFDPGTGTFSPTGTMKAARARHTATLLSDGRVLVTGGRGIHQTNCPADCADSLATAELFDPSTESFTPTGTTMETERATHTATLLSDGKVLVTGGIDRFGFASASAELFDPASETFTPTGSMETARESHTATLRNDGTVLVTGGAILVPAFCGNNCSTLAPVSLSTAELFDPTTKTFTGTADLGTARYSHTATLLNDGSVLVTGGDDSALNGRFEVSTVLSTAELYQ
jgi:WD40 repeat protein